MLVCFFWCMSYNLCVSNFSNVCSFFGFFMCISFKFKIMFIWFFLCMYFNLYVFDFFMYKLWVLIYLCFFWVYVFDFLLWKVCVCVCACACVFGAYLFLVVIIWKLWAPILVCLIIFFGVCVSYFGVIMEAMNFNYFLMVYMLHIFGYLF